MLPTLIFLLIIPVFNKAIDYNESIIFYGIPLFILSLALKRRTKIPLNLKNFRQELLLIVLFAFSTALSQDPGISYYQLFSFINILFIANLASILIPPDKFQTGLIISSLLYSVIFLLNQIKILPLPSQNDSFFSIVYGHSFLSDFIVLSLPLLVSKVSRKNLLYTLPPLLLISSALFLTQSRSSILALVITLSLFSPASKIKKVITVCSVLALSYLFLSTLIFNLPKKSFLGSRLDYWQSGFRGFITSPLFGNGPGTFREINQLYRPSPNLNSNFAHNSILNFLSDNGLIFTLAFYYFVFYNLIRLRNSNHNFFLLALISLVNSLTDPSWSNPSVLAITIYLLISPSPNQPKGYFTPLLSPFAIVLLFFFISKTGSDFLFLANHPRLSLFIDPFNLNSRLKLITALPPASPQWQPNINFTLRYFSHQKEVYQTLTQTLPLPQSQPYYQKLVDLDPQNSPPLLQQLFSRYQLSDLGDFLDRHFTQPDATSPNFNLNISKLYYQIGFLHYQRKNLSKTITYLQKAVNFSPQWGFFHLQLANAYHLNRQPDLAVKQLKVTCQQYSPPSQECQNYLADFPPSPTLVDINTYRLDP